MLGGRDRAGSPDGLEYWPVAGVKGQLMQELPVPALFEQATSMVPEDDVVSTIVCGPDDQEHIEGIRKFVDAGFDQCGYTKSVPTKRVFSVSTRTEFYPS